MSDYILNLLLENKDDEYAVFQRKLIPNIDPDTVLGVRTPVLRKISKSLIKDKAGLDFLKELPHKYFDEYQLHGFMISQIKDFDLCIYELERFLPYIDNWATCDQTSPVIFKKNKEILLPYISRWIKSEKTYTVRFAIGMLMQHYLDEDYKKEYLYMVSGVKSDEYYINMEIAWYLATALAKQYDDAFEIIKLKSLDKWVQNKTIQKAKESYRISTEKKSILNEYKIK